MAKKQSIEPRFWKKVQIEDPESCWIWIAGRCVDGYGNFWLNNRTVGAHRVSFELTHREEIHDGFFVCHTCDVPECVNPSHMFLGNTRDNTKDRDVKNRTARGDRSGRRMHPTSYIGERHPRAKLTSSQVQVILGMTGTHTSVGRKFGVSYGTIARIRAGKSWTHIKPVQSQLSL